jgi:hypothetical protein
MLSEKYKKLPSGRVQLPCLWKPGQPDVKSNFDAAKKRLYSLLNSKLLSDPELKKMYADKFKEWHKKGYTRIVRDDDPRAHGKFYYTHVPIVKLDRETTKCRPVRDGAAKFGGLSMNDRMYGPKYMNDMSDVLTRF